MASKPWVQVPLSSESSLLVLREKGMSSLYSNTLLIPSYVVLVSALALILHISLTSDSSSHFVRRLFGRGAEPSADRTRKAGASLSAGAGGGRVYYAYMVARFVGCLALLGLSIASLVTVIHLGKGRDGAQDPRVGVDGNWVSLWLHIAICMNFAYTSVLGLVSVTVGKRWSTIVTRHLNAVLLATFGVYMYRDVFPLTTYTRVPQDLSSEGWILWAKVSILAVIAVVIPLTIPRIYTPVDPENPSKDIAPEQTASILSFMIYSFVGPIVWRAYRVSHLPLDQLPPLADYNMAVNLRAKAFPHIDSFSGAKKQHLFFGLVRAFSIEYASITCVLVLRVLSTFSGPIGIYKLLHYLETGGQDSDIRPWVWIVWLFLGPLVSTVTLQYFVYLSTRIMVCAESVITQLVFEHALRMRVIAETSETSPSAAAVVGSPSTGSTTPASGGGASTPSSTRTSEQKPHKSQQNNGRNFVGRINNLVTTDLGNITDARNFLLITFYLPLQIVLAVIFLYAVLGWSAFVGLSAIVVLAPIPGLIAKLVQTVQKKRLKETDGRIQSVTETMSVLRMIKLFGWEKKMADRIAVKREQELVWIKRRNFLDVFNYIINFVIPILIMIVTYATYVSSKTTVVMKQELNASKVFSSMTVFDMLRNQLSMATHSITTLITGKVSLERVSEFLATTELLDAFSGKDSTPTFVPQPHVFTDKIGFHEATFAWSNASDGTQTPSERKFLLRFEDELKFQRGGMNLIIGPTGSGKTSVLMALLGEMHHIPSSPDSWYNLPREGGVAYAPQESWVQNETIRENIVFGSAFDETRYNKVIEQCDLQSDISMFGAGDQTEVGEKGITLSGGQKARITLARAVYSAAEIILLDDVLAALDVHTSKRIVENCFKGDLIKGRTVILATHNVAMVRPIADFVVSIKNGRVFSKGSVSQVTAQDPSLAVEVKEEERDLAKAEEEIESQPTPHRTKPTGQLIVAEEVEEGHVRWAALKLYLNGMGGNHPYMYYLTFLGGVVLANAGIIGQTWFLGYWASQYDDHAATDVRVFHYIGIYGCLMMVVVILFCLRSIVYLYGCLRASRVIHRKLVDSVLGTTLRWLDTTPTSRIIARCTQDIRAVDGAVADTLEALINMTISMIFKISAVIIISPVFIGPGVLIFLLGASLGQIYMKAQLSVKREGANAKAPVLGHFGAAITGLTSIRAYGAEQTFRTETLRRIDRYTRAGRAFYDLNRWVTIRIDALGSLFAASLAAYLVYFQNNIASTTGFSLNMAVGFSSAILYYIRVLNMFEIQGNSLERIKGYIEIEQEPKFAIEREPPAYWPSSGALTVENLSARYSPGGPEVLHDISFEIRSGERIGVVGRTGSGKSSLTLSLLRCIYTDGTVYYDGIPTTSVNLDSLRLNITIIPQMPELLSGSLRQNLDPFDQYDDATLNDALQASGLFSLQNDMDEGKLGLDSAISSSGSNLSVGQRQILALARAIVRRSKLLILDEATSAIDYKTDAVIQSSLRHQLGADVTVITVAHRLQTIMDADRIMVLDAGRIIEFDTPAQLLGNKDGKLRALVDESVDKDTLHAMAQGTRNAGSH